MPKKPTQTFGTIAFSKDGRVTPKLTRLSDVKEDQQEQAMRRFIERFRAAFPDRTISDLRQLAEDDFDFEATIDGVTADIELTELVDRDFTFQMSQGEFHAAKWQVAVQKEFGAQPWRVDVEKRDEALKARIADKAPTGRVLIDTTRTGEVGDEVLRDRRHLAGDGVIVAVVAISRQRGDLVGEPEVVARGFVVGTAGFPARALSHRARE